MHFTPLDLQTWPRGQMFWYFSQMAPTGYSLSVTADGYLYHMVRILAGTVLQAGQGKLDPAQVPAILASRDRRRAGPTMPARGLFLWEVCYPGLENPVV